MIRESELMKAIVNAGLTFSPEKGDDYIMRNRPTRDVVKAVVAFLRENDVRVEGEKSVAGQGLLVFYAVRADLAERAGFTEVAQMYRDLSCQLPLGDCD
jgi:hypothetical protein